VVKVGTSKIRLMCIVPPLAARISLRRLVVRVGTSKGSYNKPHGCGTSGALATGALQKERKKTLSQGEDVVPLKHRPNCEVLQLTLRRLTMYIYIVPHR
jgi:hypothetical protein